MLGRKFERQSNGKAKKFGYFFITHTCYKICNPRVGPVHLQNHASPSCLAFDFYYGKLGKDTTKP
jgi:hypothetical protein